MIQLNFPSCQPPPRPPAQASFSEFMHRKNGRFTHRIIKHGGPLRDTTIMAATKSTEREKRYEEKKFDNFTKIVNDWEEELRAVKSIRDRIMEQQKKMAKRTMEFYAAVTIQNRVRRHFARKTVNELKYKRFIAEWSAFKLIKQKRNKAYLKLVAFFRANLARLRFKRAMSEHRAAMKIQKLYRCYRSNRLLRHFMSVLLFCKKIRNQIVLFGTRKAFRKIIMKRHPSLLSAPTPIGNFIRSCLRKRRLKYLKGAQGKLAFYVLSNYCKPEGPFSTNTVVEFIRLKAIRAQAQDRNTRQAKNSKVPPRVTAALMAKAKVSTVTSKDSKDAKDNTSKDSFDPGPSTLFSAIDLPHVFKNAYAPQTIADTVLLIFDLITLAKQQPNFTDDSIPPNPNLSTVYKQQRVPSNGNSPTISSRKEFGASTMINTNTTKSSNSNSINSNNFFPTAPAVSKSLNNSNNNSNNSASSSNTASNTNTGYTGRNRVYNKAPPKYTPSNNNTTVNGNNNTPNSNTAALSNIVSKIQQDNNKNQSKVQLRNTTHTISSIINMSKESNSINSNIITSANTSIDSRHTSVETVNKFKNQRKNSTVDTITTNLQLSKQLSIYQDELAKETSNLILPNNEESELPNNEEKGSDDEDGEDEEVDEEERGGEGGGEEDNDVDTIKNRNNSTTESEVQQFHVNNLPSNENSTNQSVNNSNNITPVSTSHSNRNEVIQETLNKNTINNGNSNFDNTIDLKGTITDIGDTFSRTIVNANEITMSSPFAFLQETTTTTTTTTTTNNNNSLLKDITQAISFDETISVEPTVSQTTANRQVVNDFYITDSTFAIVDNDENTDDQSEVSSIGFDIDDNQAQTILNY